MDTRVDEVVLVYDTGPSAGLGHKRRMEVLASALRKLGIQARLQPLTEDPVAGRILVIDAYTARADDTDRFRAPHTVATDDLCRSLAVDLIIDPSPGASFEDHPNASRVLAGPMYALIDPPLGYRVVSKELRQVLVTMGGGSTSQCAAEIGERLAQRLRGAEISIARPPGSRWRVPGSVNVVSTLGGLMSQLVETDLVVTAGGVTLLEALAAGRPAVAVPLSQNQVRQVDGFWRERAIRRASVRDAATVALELAVDPSARRQLGARGKQLVDGRGTERVATAIVEMFL